MSVDDAMRSLNRQLASVVNVRAEVLRTLEYDLLERNQVGSGRFYPGNRRRSSAPGEPPARQTGRLQESIAITKRARPSDLSATVGPRPQAFVGEEPYPVFLEFGTRTGLEERPFIRPSIEQLKRRYR